MARQENSPASRSCSSSTSWSSSGPCAAAGGRVARNGSGKGLSADELAALPCHEHEDAAVKGGGGGGDCAVCLEALEAGDRCRRLPRCEHSFHAPCVDSWLRKSRWCPVCRADVVVEVGRPPEKAAAASRTAAGSPAALEIVVAES
uniref:RING-type domain-containing protein n=1 Tax=Leersia perrieri TaxID=77586 RepID=A0A0D9WP60_9ORYZ